MKICSKCGSEKPLEEFYRNPLTKDKRGSWCIACEKSRNRSDYVAVYSRTDAAHAAQVKYRNSPKGKARVYAYGKSSDHKKKSARWVINHAVRRGYISKPMLCTKCGMHKRLQAHHHDYSLPLDVTWLCAMCHAKEHV